MTESIVIQHPLADVPADMLAAIRAVVTRHLAALNGAPEVIGKVITAATASLISTVENGTLLSQGGEGPHVALSGPQKKQIVLDGLAELVDAGLAAYDIPYVPHAVETRVLDPIIRDLLLKMASGSIDIMVDLFNQIGWLSPDYAIPVVAPASAK